MSVDLDPVNFMNLVHTGVKSVDELMANFTDRFNGIKKMNYVQVKLHIDPSVKPFQQNIRGVPFHLKQQMEEELNRLEELDIIEKARVPHHGYCRLWLYINQLGCVFASTVKPPMKQ